MSITTNDFVRLRWSLLLLALAVVAAVAVTLISRQLVGEAEATQHQLGLQQQDIRGRIARAREEEEDIRKRIVQYRELRERGVIGIEERLDWVEQIARVRNTRRLLDTQYELSPQKPVDETVLPGGAVAGNHEVMASTMRLRIQLLHEEDLINLLDDLRRAVHAHLLVRECALERAAPGAGERGLSPQLRADCTIDWITLREKRS